MGEALNGFGDVLVAEAAGAILAHSLRLGTAVLKKGRVLSPADIADPPGSTESWRPGSIPATFAKAATRIAAAAAGDGIATATATGRANLFAEARGLLVVDRDRLDRLNSVDEAVTLGTRLCRGRAAPDGRDGQDHPVRRAASGGRGRRRLRRGRREAAARRRVCAAPACRPTNCRGSKRSNLGWTAMTAWRLARRLFISPNRRALQSAICTPAQCAGAIESGARDGRVADAWRSAIVDLARPVILRSLRRQTRPFFGMRQPASCCSSGMSREASAQAYGCARSPKVNGFDWVGLSELVMAEFQVYFARSCGWAPAGSSPKSRRGRCCPQARKNPAPEGGKEAAARPAHRRAAAGGRPVEPDGRAEQALGRDRRAADGGAHGAAPVVVACPPDHRRARQPGRRRRRRARQVAGRAGAQPGLRRGAVDLTERGLQALLPDCDGVIVCLGDMPLVAGRDLDRLIAAFNPLEGRAIIVPTRRGKRGNPVLWARRFFPEMAELAGDVGAKHLIGEHADLVCEVEMDSDGVLVDVDTPDALAALRDKMKPSAARNLSAPPEGDRPR